MLTELLGYIKEVEAVVSSGADWKYKYSRVFKINSSFIMPLLQDLGIEMEEYEVPSEEEYEYAVMCYMVALSHIKENVEEEISARIPTVG